ncbi:MAG TPA: Na/Pi symporter [Paenalcaligenes hominis]|uniref:Na/Pi symporter n=1 Tax=Paenalcaligenes hominis TaxID=643674 RepID=A0A1U9JYE7_9BURK|nr:Na/Pi symporter [Paenalcaligenes hominis]AQS50774.1 sodium:phosphate symporter [Paenalcaligenes hominis]NJB64281.1 sodium-dependent phosphate cotransporter [Paenalcaligenes hominis]GGE68801.1 sodium:phosphate symporter [Paenalcaligenes hominis]HJH24230.1 Na/Pi symporter [Paenalcaligenes hominis]
MSQADSLDTVKTAKYKWPQWLGVLALIYVLISAVSLIGTGFQEATGGRAQELFAFATNPYVGLVIGIVATALIQSSSTVTSLIVGMVAGGLPVAIAVPMVMGSNIGTTVTNTLVSLGHMRKKNEFRRAFAAATVHDFFNLLAVVIFLPLEIMFGLIERSAAIVANALVGDANVSMSGINFVSAATAPLVDSIETGARLLPSPYAGLAMVVVGLVLIFLSITYVGKLLRVLMVGKAKDVMHKAIGKGPLTGIFSGTLITVFVQSSSTTTSLMVPLAGAGTFTLRQIYPFMLGANIGTTITALLAATAVTGPMEVPAMQIALVHVLYNFFAVALIYGVPFLRELPLRGAERLSRLASKKKLYAAVWIFGVFLLLPLCLIALTTWL